MIVAYTAAAARSDYRRMIDRDGDTITVRRLPATDFQVKARALSVQSADAPGVRKTSTRLFVIVAADLLAAGFPAPFEKNKDRIIWAGRTLVVTEVDDTTRRTEGELIAYEIETEGA